MSRIDPSTTGTVPGGDDTTADDAVPTSAQASDTGIEAGVPRPARTTTSSERVACGTG